MAWFRKTTSIEPLAVSIAGVKLGNRVLFLGLGDVPLVAALALKVGLTGRAAATDPDADRLARAGRAIEREGVLVECIRSPRSALPLDDDSFDLAVLRDVLPVLTPDERVRALREVWRVLRVGGRVLAIEGAPRGGLGVLISRRTMNESYLARGGPSRALQAERFVAVRILAEREGLVFVEGAKRL